MTTSSATVSVVKATQASQNISVMFVRKLLRQKLAWIGLLICAAVILAAIFAEVLAPYDPSESHYEAILSAPSAQFWLGTDEIGRDILSRVIYGARVSIQVALVSIALAIVLGSMLGMIAGYFGGWTDHIVMRVMDGMLAFPMLVLALGIIAVLGPSLLNTTLAITIINVPSFARLVRAQVLVVRKLDFVLAARALGAGDLRIMMRHVWPSVVGNLIVYASLRASTAIITESSLSFLGLGAQPPTPSWGQMLSTAMQYWDAWWMSVFPGIAIFITVIALNFLGDSLRDTLDARLPSAS
ncbi:DppC ABC-type dipeptide/oligopeptide/nickel transport systems, permease components [Burkholderiaceae bacterium]